MNRGAQIKPASGESFSGKPPSGEPSSREQGAALLIVIIMASVLILALVLIGINTMIVRAASLDLRRRADEICSLLVQDQANTVAGRQVAEEFSRQIRSLTPIQPPGNVELTGAKLYLPTMPSTTRGGVPVAFALFPMNFVTGPDVAAVPPAPPPGIQFSAVGLPSCGAALSPSGSPDCMLQTEMYDENGAFPVSVWNNFDNAGNTVGCELNARVNVFIEEPRDIVARVIWWKPIRGQFPEYAAYNNRRADQQGEAPGLMIAVSTHLTTFANKRKFRFPARPGLPVDFRVSHDPIYVFSDSATSPAITNVNAAGKPRFWSAPPGHASERATGGTYILEPRQTENDSSRSGATPRSPSLDGVIIPPDPCWTTDTCDEGEISLSDTEELLVHCLNPLVAARNAFLSVFVELAARHGQLRSATELLLIGTQDRDVPTREDFKNVATGANGPKVIVPFGSDLTLPQYQIPYVTYNPGVGVGSLPGEFLPGKGSTKIDPWSTSTLPPELARHHSLLAGQLRYCYHLYRQEADVTPPSVGDVEAVNVFDGTELYNTDFEDSTNYSFRPRPNDPLISQRWDQDLPFQPDSPGLSQRLTAAELISVLGSTQSCPYEESLALPLPDGPTLCRKPTLAGDPNIGPWDLRPDLVGFLSYAYNIGPTGPDPSVCNVDAVPGLVAPGIVAPGVPESTIAQQACGGPGLLPRDRPAMLILLHQRITSNPPCDSDCNCNDEVAALRAIVAGATRYRLIHVVYMPDAAVNLSNAAIQNLNCAFNIPDTSTDDENHLTILSPNHGENVGKYTSGDVELDLREFWTDMLLPTKRQWAGRTALNVFNSMLRAERRF